MTIDPGQCSDGALAALALAGQERAYREFLRRYREPVYRLIRSIIRDSDEALDVTQETFVAAFTALKTYDPARPFKPWITRIAVNKCRDRARFRAVRAFFTQAAPIERAFDLASDSASPEDQTIGRAELARVNASMARLPVKLREVLVLRAVEGLTQAETAALLGVTEKTVETRLSRARRALATLIGEK